MQNSASIRALILASLESAKGNAYDSDPENLNDPLYEPPTELAALKYEYKNLTPDERKDPELRTRWRDHFVDYLDSTRMIRHTPNRITLHEVKRRDAVADKISKHILKKYALRADRSANLATLLAELTRVTKANTKMPCNTGHRASITVLATRLGKSERTIQRNLRWLEAQGIIKSITSCPEGARQRANIYQIKHETFRHATKVDIINRRRNRIIKRANDTINEHGLPPLYQTKEAIAAERANIKKGFKELAAELEERKMSRDNQKASPK